MPAVVAMALGMQREAMVRLSKGVPGDVAPTHKIIKMYHVIQASNSALNCHSVYSAINRWPERMVDVEGRAEFQRSGNIDSNRSTSTTQLLRPGKAMFIKEARTLHG